MERQGLLERDHVLALVDRLTADARNGRGGALFVVGEAGLGKTSILEWAGACAGPGLDTVAARGQEMEAGLPFGVLAEMVAGLGLDADELTGARSRSLPALEPSAPHHKVLRQLEHRSGPPALVLLDDLQWADPDSMSVIVFLARRLQSLSLGLIAALRPWPESALQLAQSLVASAGASMHRLQPLTLEGAATLLETRAGTGVDAATKQRAWTLGRGNPFLVEQLALALGRGESLPDVDRTARPTVGVGQVLLARFAALHGPTLAYVRAASVLGTLFRPDVVAAACGLDAGEVDHALETLSRSGLVTEAVHDELSFAHPLLAQALYDDVAPPLRQRLHARYLQLLEDRGLENEAAEHAVRAGPVGDQRAAALLERTGTAALASGAVATATRHLESAVRLHGDRPPPGLVLVLAQALSASGRMPDAGDACQALLRREHLGREERVAALRLLGRARYFTGSIDHGQRAMEEAATLAEALDPSAAVEPMLDQSLAAWLAEGTSRALPLAARARELAAGADGRVREMAEATWGHLAYENGDPAGLAATDSIGAALRCSEETHVLDPAELAWPWAPLYQYAMNANYAGRYDESAGAFGRAADALERAGAVNALATVAVHLANVAIRRGDLADALHQADRAEEFADLTPTVLPYVRLVRAEALVWSGRFEESEACCRHAAEAAGQQWYVRLWVAAVRGMRLLWLGAATASDEFLLAEEVTSWAGIREPCQLQWQAHAVAAHLAADREAEARRVLAWLEWAAARLPCAWPAAAAALGRARLGAWAGDGDGAAAGYREALELLTGGHLPLHRAEALLALGSLARHQGRNTDARGHLAEAVETAEACGAAHLAAVARDELMLAGGRRRRKTDEMTLTPAEFRVAQQAALGMSNADIARRLFLSVNTVETHLKRVFAKLEISSRRQLMAIDLAEDADNAVN